MAAASGQRIRNQDVPCLRARCSCVERNEYATVGKVLDLLEHPRPALPSHLLPGERREFELLSIAILTQIHRRSPQSHTGPYVDFIDVQ